MLWSTPEVKQLNKERIRKAIQANGKCTKSKISKETGLSVATCNNTLNEMLQAGEIIKADQEEIVMGRPADRFIYNGECHHVLGVSILAASKNKIICTVGNALGKEQETTEEQAEEITYEMVERCIAACLEKDGAIDSISVGIPGVTHHGIIERCDIATLVGVPMAAQLKDRFSMDVEVRNDMDYLSLGLYYAAYSGSRNLAVAYFPEGEDAYVGCGFVINGKVLKGASRFAGELRYVAEAYGISLEEQKARMKARDSFVRYVAQFVVTIISTIDPDEIILMGHGLTEEEKDAVHAGCAAIVGEEHVPGLLVENDVDGNYRKGLIRAAINRMDFPLSELL